MCTSTPNRSDELADTTPDRRYNKPLGNNKFNTINKLQREGNCHFS